MTRRINAADAPAPSAGTSRAVEVSGATRTLYVSGQIPVGLDGAVPATFAEQARLVWANIAAQLRAADMSFGNLVKVTTFLSDRRYGLENRAIRAEALGDARPASSVVIAGIFDDAWLLEIEAVAVM